jgi:uncharacterized cupredoxin-like copper-binding protein
MSRHRVLVLLAVGVLATAAALVSPAAFGAGSATYTVTALDFKFKVAPAAVKAGRVTFRVVNRGEASHNFKIAGKTTKILGTGDTATLVVTLKKGTKYPYLCTVPGHSLLGMHGVLVAK